MSAEIHSPTTVFSQKQTARPARELAAHTRLPAAIGRPDVSTAQRRKKATLETRILGLEKRCEDVPRKLTAHCGGESKPPVSRVRLGGRLGLRGREVGERSKGSRQESAKSITSRCSRQRKQRGPRGSQEAFPLTYTRTPGREGNEEPAAQQVPAEKHRAARHAGDRAAAIGTDQDRRSSPAGRSHRSPQSRRSTKNRAAERRGWCWCGRHLQPCTAAP